MQQCLQMDPVLQGKLDRAGGGKSHGGGQNMPDAQCTVSISVVWVVLTGSCRDMDQTTTYYVL